MALIPLICLSIPYVNTPADKSLMSSNTLALPTTSVKLSIGEIAVDVGELPCGIVNLQDFVKVLL